MHTMWNDDGCYGEKEEADGRCQGGQNGGCSFQYSGQEGLADKVTVEYTWRNEGESQVEREQQEKAAQDRAAGVCPVEGSHGDGCVQSSRS